MCPGIQPGLSVDGPGLLDMGLDQPVPWIQNVKAESKKLGSGWASLFEVIHLGTWRC